ncbi:MAG: 4-alpha-glucanotransferase [Candidatus Cloacimonetes bacterium]|nr:4-alpha-glucanotransferase [Candidatus Cloacimonadota bacterium]
MDRQCGILLHPTSLPGDATTGGFATGDLGDSAYRFVDWLEASGAKLWQTLPLNYPGWGFSPYSALSAFAGNPWLISIDRLVKEGLLNASDIPSRPSAGGSQARFEAAVAYKEPLLRRAWDNCVTVSPLHDSFEVFCQQHQHWLDDFAAFMSLRHVCGDKPWNTWGMPRPKALSHCYRNLKQEMDYHKFVQFLFHRQWFALREYANRKGIAIVGDIPIYVSYDSADVWSHQSLFHLDSEGEPTLVAGVPPDYFSETGQLWGNPIYRWDKMQKHGFSWWMERVAHLMQLVDWIRIDHFIGFVRYWAIPAYAETAAGGEYHQGPGESFFETLTGRFHNVRVMAEDLGVLTPDVTALKDRFGLPGMKVLHFLFHEPDPLDFPSNTVLYTGTHDNDTTVGWFADIKQNDPELCEQVKNKLPGVHPDIVWDMMEYACGSAARYTIFPMQDILELGSAARMNVPGQATGNWGWRLKPGQCTMEHAERVRGMLARHGR